MEINKVLSDKIQSTGSMMSKMVMPNIGAFVTWGLITALFIPTGWMPNEKFSLLVQPISIYLLPILIGYTGGKIINEHRGGVVGAIATMGMIVGTNVPMFAGAMIIGPIGGYLVKKFDQLVSNKVPSGFEMLINNFSSGLIGLFLGLFAFVGVGPVVEMMTNFVGEKINVLVNSGLLPLASVIIEPSKILFLNNVINHGVLGPLGLQETIENGKSILFLLETNPGPGLGILISYWFFGKGSAKETSFSALIIHFFGGIHEIYFPFILAKPLLVIPLILSSATGVFFFDLFGVGLVATPSPGSIFALLALAPKDSIIGVCIGVFISATLSFLISSMMMKSNEDKEVKTEKNKSISIESIKKVVFACDAGMGSSAMGASKFKKEIMVSGNNIKVEYDRIDNIPKDADVVIVHESLEDRIVLENKSTEIILVSNYLNNFKINSLVNNINFYYQNKKGINEMMTNNKTKQEDILIKKMILTNMKSESKYDATKRAGRMLVEAGYVDSLYIEGMLAREELTTTYIGSNVAIPHGTNEYKKYVNKTGIVILQYPNGVDFGDGNTAKLVIGIAAQGEEHMDILVNIAEAVGNQETLDMLTTVDNSDSIYDVFTQIGLGGE